MKCKTCGKVEMTYMTYYDFDEEVCSMNCAYLLRQERLENDKKEKSS